jgi:hypothetical protein
MARGQSRIAASSLKLGAIFIFPRVILVP